MLCFLYVIALTAALGTIALMIEPVLPTRAPRRWFWCAAIALSMTIPPIYQAKHNTGVHGKLAAIATYDGFLMELWSKASLGLLLWGIASALIVAYAVHVARRDKRRPQTIDGVPVVVTETLGPATTGFWRSRVIVPRWVLRLPSAERQFVLHHEEEHRRANDGRVLFIASLAIILVPWNVALWWLLRRLALAIEIDCDNRVVEQLGDPNRYGQLLLQVASMGSVGPRLQPGFIGGGGMLEHRLRQLVAPRTLSRGLRCALPIVALAILIVVLSIPHPVLGTH